MFENRASSCCGTLSVPRKVFAHFNLRKYLAQALVLSKIDYCESCILTFTLPEFLLKRLQRLQFAAASFARRRYLRDISLLKLVHKVLYMNNWPLTLRSNQVTSLCTLRSSSASRLSNPHRSSGTICPVKYPALTPFQILTAMLKHIFLNKLLVSSRVFISFIILFIVLFYFIFFYLFLKRLQRLQFAAASFARRRYLRDISLLKLVHKVLYMNNWPLTLRSNQVTSLCTLRSSSASRLSNPHRSSGTICPVKYPALTLFQILTAMLKHIFLTDKRLICRRVFISFIVLFIVLFYFLFFYLYLLVNFYHKSYPFLVFLTY